VLFPHQQQNVHLPVLRAAERSILGRAASGTAAVSTPPSRAWEESSLVKLILKAWWEPDAQFPLHENVLIMAKKKKSPSAIVGYW